MRPIRLILISACFATFAAAQSSVFMFGGSGQGNGLDDFLTGWAGCGTVSCAGGANPAISFSFIPGNGSPSRDGASMLFQLVSPSGGANAIIYNTGPSVDSANFFHAHYSVYTQNEVADTYAIEFVTGQYLGSGDGDAEIHWSLQCDNVSGYWRQYDLLAGSWKPTTIACTWTDNTWHTIDAQFYRWPGDTSCSGYPAEYFRSLTIDGTSYYQLPSRCSVQLPGGWVSSYVQNFQLDGKTSATINAYLDQVTVTPGYTGPPVYAASVPNPTTVDVVQAPSLGNLTSNNARVVDTMVANAQYFRVTDGSTQTGANADFAYSMPCGASADNVVSSLNDTFFLIGDTGGNIFLRALNPAGNNSVALYSNIYTSKGNLQINNNCGEFSRTTDTLFYDYGTNASPEVTQINLSNYNVPSIANPSNPPTETVIANFANAGISGVTWATAGGFDYNDAVNSLNFHLVEAFSTTGAQNTGCLAVEAITNAVAPVLTNNTYYVYNTCTGVVSEWTYSGLWSSTTVGTVAMDDRYCIHNIKFHAGSYATITSNVGGSCGSVVTGNGATYYFWLLGTATVIPCVACTGHETEYVNSFIGGENSNGDGPTNLQQITYATAGAGIVNTSGTSMTFVGSGIAPNPSMTGPIAINGTAYTISSCTSGGCTLTTSAGTQSGVRYNYPVTAPQNGGYYGAPQLINFPTLWSQSSCTGGSFPYSNQPCQGGVLDTHISSTTNNGSDTGQVFFSTTTIGSTAFPRSIGLVSVSSGTVTLNYGGAFASSWVGHNIIVNNTNCNVATYVSGTSITVNGCSLGTLSNVLYYFTTYPGAMYDEVDGVVGGGNIPTPGAVYREGYTYNTTLSPYFSTQNAITPCSQTGTYCFISTDWQCSLGTTNGTNTSGCAPDWPASKAVAASAMLWPQSNNNGKYVYKTSSGCTTGGSEPNPWNQTVGGTQSDGGCTWTNLGTYRGDVVVLINP